VHQERRVDADDATVTVVHDMGVCVAAEPHIGFIQGHVVTAGQDVGGGEAGHATADDGNRPRV
jgi:hypothetical protein